MVHPDYQYSPRLCGAIAWMVASGEYDIVLASGSWATNDQRRDADYKYVANRLLTAVQNICLGPSVRVSHRLPGFSREVLLALPLDENTDDFAFDNQMIVQAIIFGFRMGEISCPTRYMPRLRRSISGAVSNTALVWCGVAGLSPSCMGALPSADPGQGWPPAPD